MRRILKRIGTALLFLIVALCLAPTLIPPFLDRIYYRGPISDHFDGERFFNPTAPIKEARPLGFVRNWATGKRARWPDHVPVHPSIPPARVDGEAMRVTWIGHSTVLVQTQGLNILTDPIWSERASPFSFIGPARVRDPGVAFDRLPKIDLVLLSHGHYDHLDPPTLERLWQRDRPLIVTPLGNDTILRWHGIRSVARDWGGSVSIRPGIEVRVERVQHWSSRWGSDRNRALWSGFTIQLPGGNLFFAGDTGYGDGGWIREAMRHGPFRFAIIPIGAYEPPDIMQPNHVNPEEAVRVYRALHPLMGLGVHWGTFQLTFEAIDDPRGRLAELRRVGGPALDGFRTVEAGQSFMVPTLGSR
jgi:L-ascorbate metabolism protein UlaG (beta-lactamase superfamily)